MIACGTRLLAAALLMSAGCGGTATPGAPVCPNPVYGGDISIAVTSKKMVVDMHANAQITNSGAGVQVDIRDNRGTVTFGGGQPAAAILYRRVPWPNSDVTLLSGIGVTDGAWLLFWLYCSADGRLNRFYGERTDSTAVWDQSVIGSCDQTLMLWEMPVDLPAHALRGIPLACGFQVSNPSWDTPLSLASSVPGTALLDGLPATALVFATADCRTNCPHPSFELHSVLWEPTGRQAAFAIWYLDGTQSGVGVRAANGLQLPAAAWNDIAFPNATWTLSR